MITVTLDLKALLKYNKSPMSNERISFLDQEFDGSMADLYATPDPLDDAHEHAMTQQQAEFVSVESDPLDQVQKYPMTRQKFLAETRNGSASIFRDRREEPFFEFLERAGLPWYASDEQIADYMTLNGTRSVLPQEVLSAVETPPAFRERLRVTQDDRPQQ